MTTSPTTTWPAQIMLPGQAAAPDGPVDMRNMYLLHHAFRRDLAAFAAAAERTPITDAEVWRLLAQRWAFFGSQLHFHHTAEDDHVWPLLLDRADSCGRRVLTAMEAEHAEIDPVLESCSQLVGSMITAPSEQTRAELAAQWRSAQAILDHHLSHEETEAITLIQATITNDEWLGLERTFDAGHGFADIVKLVPWVCYRLPADVLAFLWPTTPLPMRIMIRLTARSFERRERRVFAYL